MTANLKRFPALLILSAWSLLGQTNPLQELIEAARTHSPKLKDLLRSGLPELKGRDGVAVWGQEFLFAVESAKPATVVIDHEAPVVLTNVPGTNLWYKLLMLRLGTTHNYTYFAEGKPIGAYAVAGYNPDSYPMPGVPRGTLSEKKTLASKIYPGMSSNYWVYVNPGVDLTRGAPLMVWQDGETIIGNQDLLRLAPANRVGQLGCQKADSAYDPCADPARKRRRS